MIDCVAAMPQSDEPWPCWKMKTTIPKAAASETRFSSDGLDRQHDRTERPRQQDQRQQQDEAERVGEAAEQRVQEVAVDGGDAGQRAVRAVQAALARSIVAWMPGAAPSIVANASTKEFCPLRHPGGAVAPTTPRHRAELRCDLLGVAAVLDEDVQRLHARRG